MAIWAMAAALLTAGTASAQQRTADPVFSIERNKRDQSPAAIVFNAQAGYKSAAASAVLSEYLGLHAGTDELRLRGSDNAQQVHMDRFDQYYKGIKVEHGNYVVASKAGVISYMSGNFYKVSAPLTTAPAWAAPDALNRALAFTNAKTYMWQVPGGDDILKEETHDPAATYLPKGELVYVEDFMAGDEPDAKLHLAWKFDVYAAEPMSRNLVYIDAATGKVLFVDAVMKHIAANANSTYSGPVNFHAKTNAGNYSLHDSTRGQGIHTYSINNSTTVSAANRVEITSATTTFATHVAIDAHWGAEKVYDYWQQKHNRLSWNNNNGALNSYVNYGNAYANASWNGSYMVYGDGSALSGFAPLVSLDITGHEIGHGVCQSTAALVYNRESGAMNEGFSDIWGAAIEYYGDPHETDAKAKSTWEIGEEIAGSPLRSMANPKLYGNPDTYNGQYWTPASSSCVPSGTNDNCGVHNNSGVLNKWFYLLSVGGTGTNDLGNGYAVNGIGIDTAAIIAYGTELSLSSTAGYAACRTASVNYATAQFGACSKFTEAVIRAWYAVGVGDNYTPCTAQISFNGPFINVNEGVGSNVCNSTYTAQIPVALNGPAPTGGNAVATITVTGGTAISGVHYQLGSNTVTFPAGSTAVQYLPVTIYDNGNVQDTGLYFDIAMTIAANGSNVTAASVLMEARVNIVENDFAPSLGGVNTVSTTGTTSASNTTTSPYASKFNQSHVQYIFTAAELLARNIKPRATLTRLAFFVTQKRSTQPFRNFNLSLGHTTATSFTNSFISGLTPVYSDTALTTSVGVNTMTLDNGFVWDGTSSLVVDVCFTNNGRDTANDVVNGYSGAAGKTAYNGDNGNGGGCALPFVAANVSDIRPQIRFTQEIAATRVAGTLGQTRSWPVGPGKETCFYNDADTSIIAGIVNDGNDLGCLTASVNAAGTGFSRAQFAFVNRSVKEIRIAGNANDTAGYDATIYYSNAELDGVNTANVYLIKTTAATDAAMVPGNTQILATPAIISATSFKGFRGHFTGLGRIFLTDNLPTLGVETIDGGNGIAVRNNPFRNDILLNTNLTHTTDASIRLYDITGKLVYQEQRSLAAGSNVVTVHTGHTALVPGNYVLRVVAADKVYTQKLIKQ